MIKQVGIINSGSSTMNFLLSIWLNNLWVPSCFIIVSQNASFDFKQAPNSQSWQEWPCYLPSLNENKMTNTLTSQIRLYENRRKVIASVNDICKLAYSEKVILENCMFWSSPVGHFETGSVFGQTLWLRCVYAYVSNKVNSIQGSRATNSRRILYELCDMKGRGGNWDYKDREHK